MNEGPRYGEPGWTTRPTEHHDLLPRREISYEELQVQERLKKGVDIPIDQNSYLQWSNPLHMLSDAHEMVDVVVGENSSLWRIHKNILVPHSRFFGAALKGPFTEGAENKVTLPEEDNLVFTLFVQWLYSETFNCNKIPILLRAYVLGDKIGSLAFRQDVLYKLHQVNLQKPSFTVEQVMWVADNTTHGSKLRALTMDTFALAVMNKVIEPKAKEWDILAPFNREIIQSMSSLAKANARGWRPLPASYYRE